MSSIYYIYKLATYLLLIIELKWSSKEMTEKINPKTAAKYEKFEATRKIALEVIAEIIEQVETKKQNERNRLVKKELGIVLVRLKLIETKLTEAIELDGLCIPIGTKELASHISAIDKETIDSLTAAETRPQKITTQGNQTVFISPSAIPGFFILRTQRFNGNVYKFQSYYLIGEKKLPEKYQLPLNFQNK